MQKLKSFLLFGKKLLCHKNLYYPKDDSWLLQSILKKENPENEGIALDVGCGCGIQAITLAKKGFEVFASDVQKLALLNTNINAKISEIRVRTILSDVWQKIPKKRFEVISFNPPYVPSSALIKDINIEGSYKGRYFLDRFLNRLDEFLHKSGRCYFVQTQINGLKETEEILKEKNMKAEVIAKKHIFFEDIFVVKAEFL